MLVFGGSDSFANFGWMAPTVITNFGGMWEKNFGQSRKIHGFEGRST